MSTNTPVFEDRILPFQVDDLNVRGRVVRLGPSVQSILHAHNYPKAISNLLAEAMGLCVTLGSVLKYDGVFSLQAITQGEGNAPVKALVSDVTSMGGLRGYAGFDADKLSALNEDQQGDFSKLFDNGMLAFTVDQGKHMQPYQGLTPIETASMRESVEAYFNASEQLPSKFALAYGEAGVCVVMIQRLADATILEEEADEKWNHAVIMLNSLRDEELRDAALGMAELPYRLYHDQDVRVFETRQVSKECRCSDERLWVTLKGFPEPELKEMIEEGGTTVTCHFCSTDYQFDAARLGEILEEKQQEKTAAPS